MADRATFANEQAFEAAVEKVLRLSGLLVYHTYRSIRSEPGYPDLTIVGARGVAFRELKTDKGKVSVDQQRWLDGLVAAGADAGVWRPSEHWPAAVLELAHKLGRLPQPPPA